MTLKRDIIEVEGVGSIYAAQLREAGIHTLTDLWHATIEEAITATDAGFKRVRAWKLQAALMTFGVQKDIAEILVIDGDYKELKDFCLASTDKIINIIQAAQNKTKGPRKIAKGSDIHVTRLMVNDWKRKARSSLKFVPLDDFFPLGTSDQSPGEIISAKNYSVTYALKKAINEVVVNVDLMSMEETD